MRKISRLQNFVKVNSNVTAENNYSKVGKYIFQGRRFNHATPALDVVF